MSNMGYCRFRNTLTDLEDCSEHIRDKDLSAEELRARRRLVQLCRQIIEDVEDSYLDELEAENEEFSN